MTYRALILFTALLFTGLPVKALVVGDVKVPETLGTADAKTTLVLNGAGLREKFYVDVYVAALYLPAKTPDAAAILSDEGPASMVMHVVYNEISKKKITDGWNDGLDDNLDREARTAIQPELDAFNALFTALKAGDVVSIDYVPGSGTSVRINEEHRGSVPGNRFFRDLLKVWLGPDPVSKSLKQALLGQQ